MRVESLTRFHTRSVCDPKRCAATNRRTKLKLHGGPGGERQRRRALQRTRGSCRTTSAGGLLNRGSCRTKTGAGVRFSPGTGFPPLLTAQNGERSPAGRLIWVVSEGEVGERSALMDWSSGFGTKSERNEAYNGRKQTITSGLKDTKRGGPQTNKAREQKKPKPCKSPENAPQAACLSFMITILCARGDAQCR